MLKYAFFLSLFCCATIAAQIPSVEQPAVNGRIIGGTETNIVYYSYQVSLQKDGKHHCGGVIFSNRVVITAASCLKSQETPNRLSVRAGSSNHDEGGIIERVQSYRLHEKFSAKQNNSPYDIAIVYLERSLPKNDNIRQIDLVKRTPADGADAYVSGWGAFNINNAALSRRLRRVEVNIISTKRCASSEFKYGSSIKDSMICAGAPGKDVCQGDAGGPLTVDGFVAGIVSWRDGCANASHPGVYADVYSLRDWILKYAQ